MVDGSDDDVDESRRKGSLMMCAAKGNPRIHTKNIGKDTGCIVSAVAELDTHSYLFVVKKEMRQTPRLRHGSNRCVRRAARNAA